MTATATLPSGSPSTPPLPSPTKSDGAVFDPHSITRPDKALLRYYLLAGLLAGPAYPIVILPLIFKYETLKYSFDDTGISMSWGLLFRREVHLTYRRIQDIHLTRNILQRWMGLATVSVQTASGGASPEMSIEGVLRAEALRDFLYAQMRGARDGKPAAGAAKMAETQGSEVSFASDGIASDGIASDVAVNDEALTLLREIRDALREKKERLS